MIQRKTLIIGGAGYIGLVIADRLIDEGHIVHVADNLIYGHDYALRSFLLKENFSFINYDYTKKNIKEFPEINTFDNVILLAGLVGDPITKKYPNYSSIANGKYLRGIFEDLNGLGLKKLIFTSTCSNYGLIEENEKADENHELNPLSLYAQDKVKSERFLIKTADAFDYDSVILRFSTASVKARMRFDLSVNEFVRDIYTGKSLDVYDADTWRPYCHVRDFALLISRVLNSHEKFQGEVFNAGSDQNNSTKRMIIETILKIIPEGKVNFVEGGFDKRNYKVDFTKVKKHFNFITEWSIDRGIKELIANMENGLYKEDINNDNFYGNYFLRGKD